MEEANIIRAIKYSTNLSSEQVGDMIGLSKQAVSKYLNGYPIPPRRLELIKKVFRGHY